MSELPPPAIAPGWYPDPRNEGHKRFWDGTAWTEKTAPSAIPTVETPAVKVIPKASSPQATPPKKLISGTGLGCLVAIAVGVVALIAIVGAVGASSSGDSSSNNDDLAIATCQGLVEDELKAPATASYPDTPTLSGNEISGSVDSQNGFGANIRSDFHCTVDGGNVRLDYVQ